MSERWAFQVVVKINPNNLFSARQHADRNYFLVPASLVCNMTDSINKKYTS